MLANMESSDSHIEKDCSTFLTLNHTLRLGGYTSLILVRAHSLFDKENPTRNSDSTMVEGLYRMRYTLGTQTQLV